MNVLFAKSWWEILLILGGIAGFIWFLIWGFNKIFKGKLRIGNKVEIDNGDQTQVNLFKKEICSGLVKDIRHVVSQTLLVGFEICKLKLVDVIFLQDQFTSEKFEGYNLYVKEEFMNLLCENEFYKDKDNPQTYPEAKLFFNVLRGYTEHVKKIFHGSFVTNNFRVMSDGEFQDMIKRKKEVMDAAFEKYYTDNYFDGINKLSLADITEKLKNIIHINFESVVSEIFNYAKQKKIETEILINQKEKELELYIKDNFSEDFSLDIKGE